MRRKRNVIGIGLIAALVLSSVLAANAGATRSGHFTSDSAVAPTTIEGWEDSTHRLEFASASLEGFGISKPVVCNTASYDGTIIGSTTEVVRIKPTWDFCETTPIDNAQHVTIDIEGCELKVTSRTTGDATAGIECPAGKKITITSHNGCRLRFGTQIIANAVTYTTTTENNKHAITLNATAAGITFTAHDGPCIFVPTTFNDGTLKGSVTATGKEGGVSFVNITAT